MSTVDGLIAGWGWPGASRKAHYFDVDESISVCGKWMYVGPRDPDPADGVYKPSPDDCAACKRIVTKRAAA